MKEIRRSREPSPLTMSNPQRDKMSHLVTRRNSLVDRLENGSRQIETMRVAGEEVQEWEIFWLRLLRQYEQVCDELTEIDNARELPRAG